MNIQLVNLDSVRSKGLDNGRVIHVRVLERKNASAVIEMNGLRTEAVVGTDVPDSFLAMIEVDRDSRQLRLRVLSSIKNSVEYGEAVKKLALSNISDMLAQAGIPQNEGNTAAAYLLYRKGMKFDAGLVRLLATAGNSGGEKFQELVLEFISRGLQAGPEFLSLFKERKAVIKALIEGRPNGFEGASGWVRLDDSGGTGGLLAGLFGALLGEKAGYQAFLCRNNGRPLVVESRHEENEGSKRYYFDCGSDDTGHFLIAAGIQEEGFDIKLYLNSELYRSYLKQENALSRDLLDKLRQIAGPQRLTLEVLEETPLQFWTDRGTEESGPLAGRFSGLDISV